MTLSLATSAFAGTDLIRVQVRARIPLHLLVVPHSLHCGVICDHVRVREYCQFLQRDHALRIFLNVAGHQEPIHLEVTNVPEAMLQPCGPV